jgi:hypothetical protein
VELRSDSSTRALFVSAAGFNLLAGLPFLVAMDPVAATMGLQLNVAATLFAQITMGLVVVFGWVYWMISRDPVRYRPWILLGIILKIVVVVVIYGHWLLGNIPWPLPALASGDVLYAALFLRYYLRTAA